jgi:hypothetical protein
MEKWWEIVIVIYNVCYDYTFRAVNSTVLCIDPLRNLNILYGEVTHRSRRYIGGSMTRGASLAQKK